MNSTINGPRQALLLEGTRWAEGSLSTTRKTFTWNIMTRQDLKRRGNLSCSMVPSCLGLCKQATKLWITIRDITFTVRLLSYFHMRKALTSWISTKKTSRNRESALKGKRKQHLNLFKISHWLKTVTGGSSQACLFLWRKGSKIETKWDLFFLLMFKSWVYI